MTNNKTSQYLAYGKKNIEKRLNRAKTIINNNEHLSNVDALNLGIISVFAPRDKTPEIIEEVVELYGKASEKLSLGMKVTLHNVLSQMIDAYSKQEEDYQRLIDMLKNNTDEETETELKFVKKLKKENKTLEEKYTTVEEEKNSLIERVKFLENELKICNPGILNGK